MEKQPLNPGAAKPSTISAPTAPKSTSSWEPPPSYNSATRGAESTSWPPPPGYYPSTGTTTHSNYVPSYGSTQSTAVIMPEIILVGGCPACRVGVMEDDFTCLGLLCAILFFPFGLICCLLLKTRRCSNCGAYFDYMIHRLRRKFPNFIKVLLARPVKTMRQERKTTRVPRNLSEQMSRRSTSGPDRREPRCATMPANEDTLTESPEQAASQIRNNFLRKVCDSGLQNNLARSSLGDEKDCQNVCPSSISNGDVQEDFYYQSLPVRQLHEKFMKSFVDLLLEEAIFKGTSRENQVVEWMEPAALQSAIDLKLSDQGVSQKDLLSLARNVIKYSVKTGHPRFVNQLYSSVDPYGLLGQWLTDALNPSVYTYEVSPVFSLMEEELLREMRKIVGWKDGRGEGIFCPGGSIANGYAINLARHHRFPQLKELGLCSGGKLIVFTSQDAHYSVKKLSAFLGIGTSNVYEVKTDRKGKMCVSDLEEQIRRAFDEGATPLMVSATAGTTVLGAYDSLRDLASICKKYNLWFHVDAAWGGGALMSRKHRYLLDGIELADSVTWNPHKLLAAPQQCSTLLLRHEGLLQAAHGLKASYLFQPDKFYDTSFDSGDKHVQCGRRADVFKFWFMWKAKGTRGLEKHVDRVFDLARYFTEYIRHREGFELVLEPECTNVCFWYVPPSKRHLQGEELSKVLQKTGPTVKERMVKRGSMLITYQPLRELPNFFRLVLQNSGLTEADMRFFAEEIERLSNDL